MSIVQQLELPRDVVTLLSQRAGMLPLVLPEGANRGAKATLDVLRDDAALLPRKEKPDLAFAAAVRALLYLWNGWPEDCIAVAERAADCEKQYLHGLAARQAGAWEDAKHAFQQVEEHAIYPRLAKSGIALIGVTTDAALTRFKQLLEMGECWESFAFIDLYGQCRACKLPAATERVVRALQVCELETLLVHCIESALGHRLDEASAQRLGGDASDRRRVERRRRAAQRQRPSRPAAPTRKPASSAVVTAPPPARINIKCPKCNQTVSASAADRGKPTTCGQCRASFLIPESGTRAGLPGDDLTNQPGIGVRCPRCGKLQKAPPSARGKAFACKGCSAEFLIPAN
jgi:hypothetical protein